MYACKEQSYRWIATQLVTQFCAYPHIHTRRYTQPYVHDVCDVCDRGSVCAIFKNSCCACVQAGYDTVSAVGKIATFVKVRRDTFAHAGIKDKSAVTAQEVYA